MENKRFEDLTYTSDLVASDIRCKIKNVNAEGKETYITVYNIKGERRQKIVEELALIFDGVEEITQEEYNLYYMSMILEFTDLVIDTDDLLFMLDNCNQACRELIQEFNDMVYEIQYEIAMEQMANIRNLSLTAITQAMVDMMDETEKKIKRMKDINVDKKPKRKPRRKFVK